MSTMPIKIVGGIEIIESGISTTTNMFVKDKLLVACPSYEALYTPSITSSGEGRGLFHSLRLNRIFLFIEANVFVSDPFETYTTQFSFSHIGNLDTSSGHLKIAGNSKGEICVNDSQYLYIITSNPFKLQKLTFSEPLYPSFITYHQGNFIAVDSKANQWRLNSINDSTLFPYDERHVGVFNEEDTLLACYPSSSKGDLLYLIGSRNTELWVKSASSIFPYLLIPSSKIPVGIYAINTLAKSSSSVAWLGKDLLGKLVLVNASSNGLNYFSAPGFSELVSNISTIENAYGFFVVLRQIEFYVLQFFDANITLLCNLDTNEMFYITDELLNAHPAIDACFFGNSLIFLSKLGKLYKWNLSFLEKGSFLPKNRITTPIYFNPSSILKYTVPLLCNKKAKGNFSIAISKDGGRTYKGSFSFDTKEIIAKETPKIICEENNLGRANMLSLKIDFPSNADIAVGDGSLFLSP